MIETNEIYDDVIKEIEDKLLNAEIQFEDNPEKNKKIITWVKKHDKYFKNKFKIIFPSILTFLITTFFKFVGFDSAFSFVDFIFLFFTIVLLSLNIFYSVCCNILEENKSKKITKLSNSISVLGEKSKRLLQQISLYENVLAASKHIINEFSDEINEFSKKLLANKNTIAFNYIEKCKFVCELAYTALSKKAPEYIKNINDFEISFVNFENNKTITKVIACKNFNNSKPTIFNKEFKKNKKKGYFFESFIETINIYDVILEDKNTIMKGFHFTSKDKMENCKYEQYVAIPIYCSEDNIFGYLQIASFVKNGLGENRDQINDFIETGIRPLTQLLLLAYKIKKLSEVIA